MAGDWIKMRTDLAEDPAVIDMAAALDVDEDTVVGKLHRLWSWADSQSRDGHAVGVTEKWVDRKVGCEGFARAMSDVGWLTLEARSITIPNFDRHNGKSAKTRALAKDRKASERHADVPDLSRSQRDKSVTREEKRRERANTPIPPSGAPSDDAKQPKARTTRGGLTFAAFVQACRESEEKPLPRDHSVFAFAESTGIPVDFLELAWREFARQYRETTKTQAGVKGWRQKFENCVRRNWFKLWWFHGDGTCELTTAGVQLKREREADRERSAA